ncbi:MAG: ABC transporter permease, partial [Candidatus Dormibacteria bacterium]
IAINGTTFHVVGIVAPTLTGNVSDLYFDLTTLQSMATQTDRINEVFISARSASDVNAIAAAIHRKLPGAQILTAKSLDEGVTGSLADAHTLAASLGTALAIVILLGSFLIAILLTLSNVNKRVREIGSLRAMGWSRSRVVRQLLGETVGISVIGGILGLLIGFAICTIIDATGPALQATTSGLAVGASTLGSTFGQPTSASSISTVHVTAPLTLPILLLGFGAAVLGGIIAGTIGGWRAAQLSPAEALRNLG